MAIYHEIVTMTVKLYTYQPMIKTAAFGGPGAAIEVENLYYSITAQWVQRCSAAR